MFTSSAQSADDGLRDRLPTDTRPGWCWCEQEVEPGPTGGVVVLRVYGEIDLGSRHVVEQALTAVLDRQPADLVVDLAGVTFCSVGGFALLVTAAEQSTRVALSGLLPHLDRIATLLWPGPIRRRYPSVAAAVTAIRIERSRRPT